MRYLLDHKRRLLIVVADVVVTAVAYLLAFAVRFEGEIPTAFLLFYLNTVPILAIVRVGCFVWYGLYRGMWAYASVSDLLAILKAASAGSVVFIVTLILFGIRGFSRGVLVLDWLLVIFLIGGSRLGLRLYRTARPARRAVGQPVLVIGAGDAGESVIRELQSNPRLKYRPVGILDDDREKHGLRIHGVPVLGGIAEVKAVAAAKGVEEVIIAIPSADRRTMRGIFDACQQAGLRMKTVPGLGNLLAGTARVSELREIRLEDLLPREPARLDLGLIREFLRGRRVMVTGAGGSIGSEISRQVAACDPAALVLVDKGENALFEISQELRDVFPSLPTVPLMADIKHVPVMEAAFAQHRPEVVFDAAAFKHVPLMESHPHEAVLNNVVATRRLAEVALEAGTAVFVLISTDKAVNPSSVMGATKRAAERYLQSLAEDIRLQKSDGRLQIGGGTRQAAGAGGSGQGAEGSRQTGNPTSPGPSGGVLAVDRTIFCAVRFGNVLGSSGSVVPTFRRQIERGGPVTVTHPEITRYFMTIPEAVQLVLRAATLAKGGEIFVLDMGTPVRIADLARDLIRLSGLTPGEEVEVAFTGLRPGEKLTEELWYPDEDVGPTPQDKLRVVRRPPDTAYPQLLPRLTALERAAIAADTPALLAALQALVPEYQGTGGSQQAAGGSP